MSITLPTVSVLFVTYNRPHTLVAAYETFLYTTDYPRNLLELVVTDDGSDPDAQDLILRLGFDTYRLDTVNRGLGANINRGLDACRGEFILMLQDDWMCMRDGGYLRAAIDAFRAYDDLGLVIFRDWGEATIAEVRSIDETSIKVLAARTSDGTAASRTYSDNPHLKRRDFHDVVGRYSVGVPMTTMEKEMTERVGRQTRYKSALISGVAPFTHIGDRYSFNPGRRRSRLQQMLAFMPLGTSVLDQMRRFRHTLRQWTGREGMWK